MLIFEYINEEVRMAVYEEECFSENEAVISRERLELLKAAAHPVRIKILEELTKGVKCVSDLEEFLDIRQPNVSQHLSLLRRIGIIDYYMDGRLRCYFLKDPLMPDLLRLLKTNYEGDLPAPACCPVTKKGKYPGQKKSR
jgi:ArsR family transcriptional regulator